MAQQETIDHVIRSALRAEVRSAEPSVAVREALLAAAADDALRSALGPTVPPVAEGLQEDKCESAVDWSTPVTTAIPVARRHLLMLAAPLYAVR
jgi:hypothetical protein